jgi:CheY-like chemotaxis protein
MPETILIVEDNAQAREIFETILADAGYRTLQAADGLEALAQVEAERPALILLDLMMPRMSGLEVCRRLKRAPATAGIPILVVTAARQFATKEEAINCGAEDFIGKPIREPDLLARVRALLKVQGVRRELDRALAYLHELDAELQAHRQSVLRAAAPGGGGGAPPIPEAGTVLLIDDETLTRNYYGTLLREQGYFVFQANSPPEGFGILDQHAVEAVLLAERMRGYDGAEALARIRAVRPALPVIMLVEDARPTNAALVADHGAFDLLIKGTHATLVSLAVTRAVRYSREIRQLRAFPGPGQERACG